LACDGVASTRELPEPSPVAGGEILIPAESTGTVAATVTGWFGRIAGEPGRAQLQV
jgi:hypothetical protein